MLAVADIFDDITLAWFQAALDEGGVLDVELASIDVVLMDPSKGLVGDLASVHVTYRRGAGPTSFVVKLPAQNPDSRRIGGFLAAYAREVAFYRYVAPVAANTRLPICYYAGEDLAAERWTLILEEVDADPFDYFAGATPAMANNAIDALADFHAVWWQSPTTFDWMPGVDTGNFAGLQTSWVEQLPTFVERYRDSLPALAAEWVLEFAPRLSAWAQRVASEPLTMVHSDYRLDNLLFQGDQVTMIDWQTAMRAPAAMDVSCFIATSLSIAERRRHEDSLIDRYLDRLASNNVVVDRSWFLQSYEENLLWWMGQFGNNLAHLDPGDDRVQAGLTTMVKRVYTAALDRDVGRLL